MTYIRRCQLVNREVLDRVVSEEGLTLELELPTGESVFRFLGEVPTSDQTGWIRPA